MGKCIFLRKGSVHSEPVTFADNFADNTWEQIVEACQINKVPEAWKVGDNKPMTINGTSYQIDIIGKNHNTYATGGTAPLTFQLHDCYSQAKNMGLAYNNNLGWGTHAMRTEHLPEILALMPSEVQAGIKEVQTIAVISSSNVTLETVNDKLFLLSEYEVFGKHTNARLAEGTQYAYYAAGNSKIKHRNGSEAFWWTRSLCGQAGYSSYVCLVSTDGTGTTYQTASNTNGVSFAFCF